MNVNSTSFSISRRTFLRATSITAAALPLLQPIKSFAAPWRFLSEDEAETLRALCDRIIPVDSEPGAAWAGAVEFIDRQLSNYYRSHRQLYRIGLSGINEAGRNLHGKPFAELTSSQQDDLLQQLQTNQAPAPAWKLVSATVFFDTVVDHTMQSFYGPPRHGGNRDAISWRMLRLPVAPVRSRRPVTAPWNIETKPL